MNLKKKMFPFFILFSFYLLLYNKINYHGMSDNLHIINLSR